MEKFQNKYRIPSARLKGWDYGSAGAYFITICTKDRVNYFGKVEQGMIIYSPLGAIADVLWYEIEHHTSNVVLGEFVVMPNHIHGILMIEGLATDGARTGIASEDARDLANPISAGNAGNVELLHRPSTTRSKQKNELMASISPKANTVSAVVRSYKSAVTKHANRLQMDFAWQPRFYDHIIGNGSSHAAIAKYITENPLNWNEDEFHSL